MSWSGSTNCPGNDTQIIAGFHHRYSAIINVALTNSPLTRTVLADVGAKN